MFDQAEHLIYTGIGVVKDPFLVSLTNVPATMDGDDEVERRHQGIIALPPRQRRAALGGWQDEWKLIYSTWNQVPAASSKRKMQKKMHRGSIMLVWQTSLLQIFVLKNPYLQPQ